MSGSRHASNAFWPATLIVGVAIPILAILVSHNTENLTTAPGAWMQIYVLTAYALIFAALHLFRYTLTAYANDFSKMHRLTSYCMLAIPYGGYRILAYSPIGEIVSTDDWRWMVVNGFAMIVFAAFLAIGLHIFFQGVSLAVRVQTRNGVQLISVLAITYLLLIFTDVAFASAFSRLFLES